MGVFATGRRGFHSNGKNYNFSHENNQGFEGINWLGEAE